MTDPASALQAVQIGVEATPGTVVPANKVLQSITEFSVNPNPEVRADLRSAGTKFGSFAVPGREWVEASLSGDLSYSEIVYLLAASLQNVTPAAPGVDGESVWDFVPSRAGSDDIKTYTVDHGNDVRAHRFAYGFLGDLTFNFTPDECTFAGSFMARPLADGITMTASPTSPELVMIHPEHVNLYLDTTPGTIGTTQLDRGFAVSLNMNGLRAALWALNRSNARGFAAHVQPVPDISAVLTLAADAAGMANLTRLRDGDKVFVRLEAIGPVIGGTTTYELNIDFAARIGEMGEFGDNQGVLALDWTLRPNWDDTLVKALSIQAVNQVAAL